MPAFSFSARARDGKSIQGVRVSASEGTLSVDLAAEGLFLVSASEIRAKAARKGRGPRTSRKELIGFLLHLGSYIESGVPLMAALEDFRMEEKPVVDAAIQDLRRRIEGGSSLSDAMEAYPTLFSPLHVSMIRAGETTGRLDSALQEVVKLVEWEEEFTGQVKQASTYPLIVLGLVILVVFLVSTFALPAILKLLKEMNVPLPLPTRIFIAFGQLISSWGWLVMLLLVGGFIAFRFALKTPSVRLWWDTKVLEMPLIGTLATKMGLSRFSTFFASQYRAGIPIVQVLKECQDITGNARLSLCVRKIREGVEGGERLGVMAASVGYFPKLVIRMLSIGEEAGNLEATLGKVSLYFDNEVRASIKRFFQLLEPILIVGLASVIVFVAIAILLPIYTLIGNINGQVN
jgi:type II secretory pathway component PulF